jgi:predicted AlkP superfamily pyrophosphatase or phosphodiesterase
LLDAAKTAGARVWVVSEYGHCDVNRPVLINRLLRQAGLLSVRPGPFGEVLETFQSRAFAVCDHQVAHVYVPDVDDRPIVRDFLANHPAIARVLIGRERDEWGLDHPRSGDLVALSEPDAWFAYPYWLDDRQAPDFAPTVDIHRKPGYDPCELFFDPKLPWPKGRAMFRLLQKKLGFRTLFDVVPLDPAPVRGSHGLRAPLPDDRPLLIGDGPSPNSSEILDMTDVHGLLLRALVPES